MYERFFGLTEEPFRLTPDPRYLYLSPKHAEALAHLRLGLSESSGFVCITGEVGTGKTTLLRAFLAELGPNVAAAYTFVPPLSALDLLRRICKEFGVVAASDTQSDLLDALQAFLTEQRAAGRLCIVILDEAQALSAELLEQVRLLLNFETTTEKLLRIVLVGQPQLRKLLLAPDLAQLNQRITLRWHLGPLSRRQTAAYVRHRLSVASDGRATRLLTPPALRLLHALSGGVPRLINMIGHRALLTAFVVRHDRVRRRAVAHAYREIQSVPLPGTLSWAYRAGVAVAGLAAGAALFAVAGPGLEWISAGSWRDAKPTAIAASAVAASAVEVAAPSAAPDDAPVTALVAAETPPTVTVAALEPPPATGAPVPTLSNAQLRARLTEVDAGQSARSATARLLSAWSAPALGADETDPIADFEAVAWRRGLQAVSFTANRGMLRLLDLPVQLSLRIPGYVVPRAATVLAIDGGGWQVDIDGTTATLSDAQLDEFWTGQARLLWRDFESLGPVLAAGARGVAVMRLQQLLQKAGTFTGAANGVFDAATEEAVQRFQRDHQLDPDGRVGTFTRLVLYRQVAGYERPTLTTGTATS